MLKQAVDHYNEILSRDDIAAASVQALDEGLERSRLIFGGRRLTPYLRPHFVTEDQWKKVKDAAVADDALLAELGITEAERELVKIDPGYRQVSPTARLDSFLTEDAYSFVELNGESPAGIAYADSATEIFQGLPAMKEFAERYSVRGFSGRPQLLEVLLACYAEYLGRKPEKSPVIAVVDLADLPTQQEFELFKEYFESQGYDALICSPQQLEFTGGELIYAGVKIDIVYKRLLVNEYLPIAAEHPALLDACKAGTVCMVNSFRGKLVHKKAVFAVLTNERYAHLFDEAEREAIRQYVPWTRKLRAENTLNKGIEVDLFEWTRVNAHKLVLKPNDDYGGHGIYIGWNSSESEWDDAIKAALADGDYLVQERVSTARETFPMLLDYHGKWEMIEQLVDLDPLLFNGVVGSAFTRLSSSELANVSAGGGMVPTFIIDEKS
jgi:hypothetical protein